jgi:hypothetical protein
MAICPVCNGFQTLELPCPGCGSAIMTDRGREMDYYDDYSAYMPIDQMKLEDGYKNDLSAEQCPHFVKCGHCGFEATYLIQE